MKNLMNFKHNFERMQGQIAPLFSLHPLTFEGQLFLCRVSSYPSLAVEARSTKKGIETCVV